MYMKFRKTSTHFDERISAYLSIRCSYLLLCLPVTVDSVDCDREVKWNCIYSFANLHYKWWWEICLNAATSAQKIQWNVNNFSIYAKLGIGPWTSSTYSKTIVLRPVRLFVQRRAQQDSLETYWGSKSFFQKIFI